MPEGLIRAYGTINELSRKFERNEVIDTTEFQQQVQNILGSDQLTVVQKLVAIAHITYDNPTIEHLAKAANVELETVRRIVLQLVQSGWLTLNEKHIKMLVEQIVSHQIESERQSEREDFGLARYEADAANELEVILEAAGYTLLESEESLEWLHVYRLGTGLGAADELILTFDIGNWAWRSPQPTHGGNPGGTE